MSAIRNFGDTMSRNVTDDSPSVTERSILRQKAIEEIIIREYRRAHDPTWPVAAARSIIGYLEHSEAVTANNQSKS